MNRIKPKHLFVQHKKTYYSTKITSFVEKIRGRRAVDDIKLISKIIRHVLMTDTFEKNIPAILTTCCDLSEGKKLHSCANWPLPTQQYTNRHWVHTTYLDSQTPKQPLLLASCRRCLLLAIRVGFLRGYIQLVFGVIPRLRPFPSWLGGCSWAFCSFRWHDLRSEGVIGKKGISMNGFGACQSPTLHI